MNPAFKATDNGRCTDDVQQPNTKAKFWQIRARRLNSNEHLWYVICAAPCKERLQYVSLCMVACSLNAGNKLNIFKVNFVEAAEADVVYGCGWLTESDGCISYTYDTRSNKGAGYSIWLTAAGCCCCVCCVALRCSRGMYMQSRTALEECIYSKEQRNHNK